MKLFFNQALKTLIIIVLIVVKSKAQPPQEIGEFYTEQLLELVKLDPEFKLDIRYATNNNFTKQAVYKQARAFLQDSAAWSLVKVNQELKQLGYGLLIFDGYRPWSITKLFWDITPDSLHHFVANPKSGSKHNRGCAIDLSLYDLKTGKEIEMTSAYDEMSPRSYPNYTGGTAQQRNCRDLLIKIMKKHGFTVYEYEWWHFDFKNWKNYKISDIPFEDIK